MRTNGIHRTLSGMCLFQSSPTLPCRVSDACSISRTYTVRLTRGIHSTLSTRRFPMSGYLNQVGGFAMALARCPTACTRRKRVSDSQYMKPVVSSVPDRTSLIGRLPAARFRTCERITGCRAYSCLVLAGARSRLLRSGSRFACRAVRCNEDN